MSGNETLMSDVETKMMSMFDVETVMLKQNGVELMSNVN